MGTILESTNELAKRFGVEGEMTIKDTLDAIVKKLDDTYTDSKDIAEAVAEFSKNDGPDARLGTKTITANDTYTALDEDLDGYSSVTVNVPEPVLITKSVTANDTYVAADDNADGYSSVTVNVASPALTPETIGGIMSANVSYGSRDYSITFTEKTLAEVTIIPPSYESQYYIYNHVTATLLVPASKIDVPALSTTGDLIIFTPADDFDGIYVNGTKYEPTTPITPGDGKWYAYVGNSSYGVTYQGVNASGQDVNIRVVTT